MNHKFRPITRRLSFALLMPLCAVGLALAIGALAPGHTRAAQIQFSTDATKRAYLPIIARAGDPCAPIPGMTYDTIPPAPVTGIDPAGNHLINLGLRGYEPVNAFKGLITVGGEPDPNAPQFPSLFTNNRTAVFRNVYALHKWDNACNCPSPQIVTKPQVTVAGLATTPGEIIRVPDSGYDIGGGHDVMVLYASSNRLTLKYTREDDIVSGYAVYLENVCVEPSLLALYRTLNAAGRHALPALRGAQPLGRAMGNEIGVAVRDAGTSQDPRVRSSWWIGR
jgi:hypothetical protein